MKNKMVFMSDSPFKTGTLKHACYTILAEVGGKGAQVLSNRIKPKTWPSVIAVNISRRLDRRRSCMKRLEGACADSVHPYRHLAVSRNLSNR
jgi:hypothetical protein